MAVMKVSILIPVYGVEKYIERCVRSALGQGYADIEYIFVDDASPDGSVELLRGVAAEYPDRDVKIFANERNMGLAATRNVAVGYATGDYLMHVDSDDYIAPHAVEKLVARAVECDADMVVFDSVDLYRDFSYTVREAFPYISKVDYIRALLWRQARVNLWSKFIRRSLYDGVAATAGIDYGEDFHVVPQLAYNASRIVKLDEPLYFYMRFNPDAISHTLSPQKAAQAVEAAEILERFFVSRPDAALYAPMMAGMKLHNKITLLQAGGRQTWRYARGLYGELEQAGVRVPLPASQRLVLLLARLDMWWVMGAYRSGAKVLKLLKGKGLVAGN